MAYDVKILFRDNLVSAGRSSSGAPVQGKQRVVGLIDVTSYTTGGEDVLPKDIGLTGIDYVSFRVVDEVDASSPGSFQKATYDDSTNKLVVTTVNVAGASNTELTNGSTAKVQFESVGDSAHLIDQVV